MDYRIEQDENGFSIYQPAEADFAKLQETRRVWEEKGNRYLASLKQTPVPEKKITGSFIYAHPPDYRYSMLNCTAQQWYEHLVRLQQLGVDTVIFQAAAWKELNECYYPSKCFRTMKIFDVLAPAMEAAARPERPIRTLPIMKLMAPVALLPAAVMSAPRDRKSVV